MLFEGNMAVRNRAMRIVYLHEVIYSLIFM